MNTNINKNIRVVEVISPSQVALNVGANDGIEKLDEFIVYGLSEKDIIDPETKQNLGKLEIFKGLGVVSYVQEKMCILNAISRNPLGKLSVSLGDFGDYKFVNPQKNDYAKPNATKRESD